MSDTVEGNRKIASKMKDTIYNTVSAYACVCVSGGAVMECVHKGGVGVGEWPEHMHLNCSVKLTLKVQH